MRAWFSIGTMPSPRISFCWTWFHSLSSVAPPSEKISWGKLGVDTPTFMIESDATIVAPLLFAIVLGL